MNSDQQITDITKEFDFYRVHKCMTLMKWTWTNRGIPTVASLKRHARSLIRRMQKDPALISVSCGGFEVVRTGKKSDGLKLSFVVTDYDTNEYQ